MSKRRNTEVVIKRHVKPDGDYLKENDYGQDTDNNSGAADLTRRQNNKQQNRQYESIHIEDFHTEDGDVIGSCEEHTSCEAPPQAATGSTDQQQSTACLGEDTASDLTRRQKNKQQYPRYESIHIEDLLTVNGDVAGAASVDEATVVSPKMEHGAESTPVDGAEPEQNDNDQCPGETMGNDMIVEENCVYESLGAATSQFAV